MGVYCALGNKLPMILEGGIRLILFFLRNIDAYASRHGAHDFNVSVFLIFPIQFLRNKFFSEFQKRSLKSGNVFGLVNNFQISPKKLTQSDLTSHAWCTS